MTSDQKTETLIQKIQELVGEAYQLAGWALADIPTHPFPDDKAERLLDMLSGEIQELLEQLQQRNITLPPESDRLPLQHLYDYVSNKDLNDGKYIERAVYLAMRRDEELTKANKDLYDRYAAMEAENEKLLERESGKYTLKDIERAYDAGWEDNESGFNGHDWERYKRDNQLEIEDGSHE